MSDDKKLPVRYHKPETAPTPVNQAHTPVHDRSLLGRIFSGLVSDVNKAALKRSTEEVQAHTDNAKAKAELADAMLARDRKIEHYVKHRADIIADDHEEHRERMAASIDHRTIASEERAHQLELARVKRKQELAAAQFEAAKQQWGLQAFNQGLTHRQERNDELYRGGALEALYRSMILGKRVEEERGEKKPAEPAPKQQSNIDQMLQIIDQQIELAAANHASQDVIDYLVAMRAALSAQHENENKQSE